ncbi:MAG: hypothetical protein WBD05_10520 [Phycisphaerae bacterium]
MTTEERLAKVERELADLRAEVRTRRVIIEDENGASRAVLDVNEDEPGLKLYDKTYDESDNEVQGSVRVVLSADVTESGLKLYNGEGNLRAALSVATEPYDEEENGQASARLKLDGGGGDDEENGPGGGMRSVLLSTGEEEEENGKDGPVLNLILMVPPIKQGYEGQESHAVLKAGKDGPGLELYTGPYGGTAALYDPPTRMVRPYIGNFQGKEELLGNLLREGDRLAILSAGANGMGLILCDEKGRRIAKTHRA